MKKKFVFALIILLFSQVYSETVQLEVFTSETESFFYDVNKNVKILFFSKSMFPEQESNFYIIDTIKGFEKLESLEIIEFQGIDLIYDLDFLADITNLKELYISNVSITSLNFLEKLKNLELIDMYVYLSVEDAENIKQQEINLEQLENLKRIKFSTSILNLELQDFQYFNSVPYFTNVKNFPIIFLGDNGIEYLSDSEIEILTQFSEIHLWPNPILSDIYEMEKIKDLNVITK